MFDPGQNSEPPACGTCAYCRKGQRMFCVAEVRQAVPPARLEPRRAAHPAPPDPSPAGRAALVAALEERVRRGRERYAGQFVERHP